MQRSTGQALATILIALACFPSWAQNQDDDALSLQTKPVPETAKESPLRLTYELGFGRLTQRQQAGDSNARRTAFDARYSGALAEDWRLALSDRLEYVYPASLGADRSTRNLLREAYVAWQQQGASTTVDLGRINVRQGPAFGYNPTDYFRQGALRTITTADPVALRENRLGTVMVRASRLWSNGSVAVALAPKLGADSQDRTFNTDFGFTNFSDRALLTANARVSERLSGQLLVLTEKGNAAKVGANATALVSDAAVVYAEWGSVKTPTLLESVLGTAVAASRHRQAAIGITYTLPNALSLTVEAEYNGSGADAGDWSRILAQGPQGYQRFIALTQPNQELGSRRAWLIYATQKNFGIKQLDLTGFVRQNAIDHSYFAWLELRHHWDRFDAALQWQRAAGSSSSEYGVSPYKQTLQLLGYWYF